MKLSVSLPAEVVEVIDAYARDTGLPSRSAVVQRAVRALRSVDLERDYADAWTEWESSGAEGVWSAASLDG